jgi:hypothetical protein
MKEVKKLLQACIKKVVDDNKEKAKENQQEDDISLDLNIN